MLLQKTLLNVEGLGRQLDPDLDLWVTAKPFLERWMQDQIGCRALQRRLLAEAPYIVAALPELPRLIHQRLLAPPPASDAAIARARARRSARATAGSRADRGCCSRSLSRLAAAQGASRSLAPAPRARRSAARAGSSAPRRADQRRAARGAGTRSASPSMSLHEVLERRLVELVGRELERHRFEAVDVAQRDVDDLPVVVGLRSAPTR